VSGPTAILFDMDGTLVDSDAAVERAWRDWADRHGLDAGHVLGFAHGNVAARTVRHLAPHLSEAEIRTEIERQHELEYADLDGVVATPGAHRLLALVERRGTAWAVVTSADNRLAKARLTAAGIHPPVLVTVDDVRRSKPDPEGYLKAAAKLAVDPASCLVVEDSEPGAAAGRAAGMRVAALKGVAADLPLRDLDQLAEWLRRPTAP